MTPKIEGRKLLFTNGKVVELPYPVSKIQGFEGGYVALVEPPIDAKFNENAYGVDENGQLLWQIEKVKHIGEDSPYTGISEKGGAVLLHNWDGFTITVEPKTGKILKEHFTK